MMEAIWMAALLTISADAAAGTIRPIEITAHRGESSLAPENTLAAVELAWKRGADAVEIDVHLTADGHLVVCHDGNMKRTAGRELVIAKSTLEELRALDVGVWKGAEWAGQKIPLLEEVLKTIPEKRRLYVEVKAGPETIPALKKVVEASQKRAEQVVIISFNAAVIAAAKCQMPQHRANLLVGFKQDKQTKRWSPTLDEVIASARAANADNVALSAEPPLDRAFIEGLHQAGLDVYAWTIDSPEVVRRMIEYASVGITTNRAGWMKEQLGLAKD
jgi:glycerophosphoryl diester phosphodiesterase